jgi:hypothetical protein
MEKYLNVAEENTATGAQRVPVNRLNRMPETKIKIDSLSISRLEPIHDLDRDPVRKSDAVQSLLLAKQRPASYLARGNLYPFRHQFVVDFFHETFELFVGHMRLNILVSRVCASHPWQRSRVPPSQLVYGRIQPLHRAQNCVKRRRFSKNHRGGSFIVRSKSLHHSCTRFNSPRARLSGRKVERRPVKKEPRCQTQLAARLPSASAAPPTGEFSRQCRS